MDCATQALEKYNTEEHTAARIKESDKKDSPTGHCTVGGNLAVM